MIYIRENKYYIVDLTDIAKPFLLQNQFKTVEDAEKAVIRYRKYDFKNFPIISGIDAIKHRLKFRKFGKIWIHKWIYPEERFDRQKRKTWRTVQRRKIRRRLNNNNT